MTSEVNIKGMAELDKLLAELPDKLQRNVMRSALRAGAQVIKQRAQELAPVHTGKLRDSIRVSVRIKAGVPVATVKAGGNAKGGAFYAHMVEYGTAAHFIKPKTAKSLFLAGLFREGVDHPGAVAHPFMRPAFDAAAQEAVLAVALKVKARLTKQGLDTPDISVDDPS
jgi:HK97 gp10 family phage protein